MATGNELVTFDMAKAMYEKLDGEIDVLAGVTRVASWADVQAIVRAGLAAKFFSIGDQFTCQRDGVDMVWDVIGFDHDTPADPRFTHSMTLQLHDVYKNLQFDAREAFYYAETGLAAGTYHFTIGAHNWVSGDIGKTAQFTLSSALPAGGQLVFNQAHNASVVGATVSAYASATDTAAIETVTLTEGNGGTSLGEINNVRQSALNSMQRALLGNNNYRESAVRQWLNSGAAAGSVWTPQNVWDRPPSWASTEKGFQNGLDADFLAVVDNVTKTTAEDNLNDGSGSYTTTETFFLVSREEVFAGKENGQDEGGAYAYYSQYSDLNSEGTGADSNRIKYLNGVESIWWIRTPHSTFGHNARSADATGMVKSSYANYDSGVAPTCNIM